MKPVFNMFFDFVDNFLIHVPPDKQQQAKEDLLILVKAVAESGAKGAAEGLKNKTGT